MFSHRSIIEVGTTSRSAWRSFGNNKLCEVIKNNVGEEAYTWYKRQCGEESIIKIEIMKKKE